MNNAFDAFDNYRLSAKNVFRLYSTLRNRSNFQNTEDHHFLELVFLGQNLGCSLKTTAWQHFCL